MMPRDAIKLMAAVALAKFRTGAVVVKVFPNRIIKVLKLST